MHVEGAKTKLAIPHRYFDVLNRYPSTEELTLLSCVGEVMVQISSAALSYILVLRSLFGVLYQPRMMTE
jgi:hypothetical protein